MNLLPPLCPHRHESHLGLSGYTNWYLLRKLVQKVKIQPIFKPNTSMDKPFSYKMGGEKNKKPSICLFWIITRNSWISKRESQQLAFKSNLYVSLFSINRYLITMRTSKLCLNTCILIHFTTEAPVFTVLYGSVNNGVKIRTL